MEALIRSRGNVIKFGGKSTQGAKSNVNDSCPMVTSSHRKDFIAILRHVQFEQEEALNSLGIPSRLA